MLTSFPQKYLGHTSGVYDLIGWDDDHFLSCSGDGYLVKWPYKGGWDGQVIAQIPVQTFSIHQLENNMMVVGDMNGQVYWINVSNQQTVHNYSVHKNGVFEMVSFGDILLSAGGKGLVTKWAISEMRPLESVRVSSKSIRCLWALSEEEILCGASDGHIYLLNVRTMKSRTYIENAHDNSVFSVCSSKHYIYSGSRDAHLNQYSLSGELIKSVPAHWFTINDIKILSEEYLLITASRDKKIRVWDSDTLELLQSIDLQKGGHLNSVNALLVNKTNRLVLSGSDDRSIGKFSY